MRFSGPWNGLRFSGPWNGLRFSGVPEMNASPVFSFIIVAAPDEIYYSFKLNEPSVYSRLLVKPSGELQRLMWTRSTGSWNLFWYAPKDQCDDYRECEDYGICDTNASLYYVAPSCLAFLSIPWIFVELPVLLREQKLGLGFRFDFLVFGTNSLCAFALNLAVFLLVGKTSALTMNVAGVVKDWLLIAFSWSVIKDTVTGLNLFGYRLAFLGVGYYNHLKLQAMKAKDGQRKSEPPADVEESGKLLPESEKSDA